MRRFGFQSDPFHRAKRSVLYCETARFLTPLIINGLQTASGLTAEYQKTKFRFLPQAGRNNTDNKNKIKINNQQT